MLSFWTSKASAAEVKAGLPSIAYSPPEAESPFADPAASGEHFGGLSQFQIIRYTESPVGPYDELIVCLGFFAYEKGGTEGKREKMKNLRITRIYVSQKSTCWNGRKNWNIPKHLARFEWDESPDGKATVRVYSYDTAVSSDSSNDTESVPSEKFFFQAAFQPVRWAPSFPLALSWLKYVGIDTFLVQPPLPDGRQGDSRSGEELIGTSRWCIIQPAMTTRKATLGWVDMSQHDRSIADDDDQGGNRNSSGGGDTKYDNFWPGMRRWNVAIRMENADIGFGEGLHWGAHLSPHARDALNMSRNSVVL
ncbi:hypothetical protein F4779DRAFT_590284 [Xylariaceae sp. FL0662B]|nr:hypothetical protein F4779DRAFT_590284 [Xylariaceae sp. FL0662B]